MHPRADLIGPLMTPRSQRRTFAVLAVALVLSGAILAMRLINDDPSNGILALEVIPIALAGLELGLLPALAFAALAMVTVGVWDVASSMEITAVGYVARALVYFPVAAVIGWVAGRLRTAVDAAQKNERWLAAIVENSPDALITSDEQGRILGWNPAAEETFGWRSDEVMGKGLADVAMPEPVRELYWQGLQRFLEDGDRSLIGQRFEAVGLRRDGHDFPIELAISAVREGDRWIFHAFLWPAPPPSSWWSSRHGRSQRPGRASRRRHRIPAKASRRRAPFRESASPAAATPGTESTTER